MVDQAALKRAGAEVVNSPTHLGVSFCDLEATGLVSNTRYAGTTILKMMQAKGRA